MNKTDQIVHITEILLYREVGKTLSGKGYETCTISDIVSCSQNDLNMVPVSSSQNKALKSVSPPRYSGLGYFESVHSSSDEYFVPRKQQKVDEDRNRRKRFSKKVRSHWYNKNSSGSDP